MGGPLEAVLEILPVELQQLIASKGELVSLPALRLLARAREWPRYAHVIASGCASLVTVLRDGRSIHTGPIGLGSLVEVCQLSGAEQVFTESIMVLEGSAFRLPFRELLAASEDSEPLRRYVLREMQHRALVSSQLVACSYYHELAPRLATVLLLLHEQARSSQLNITQESLASILGVRRTTLTVTAGNLQRRKLIQYNRGQITLCAPEQLASYACECLQILTTINRHTQLSHTIGEGQVRNLDRLHRPIHAREKTWSERG